MPNPIAIEEIQKAVQAQLENYICWWKLSVFSHHHNTRAQQVLRAILLSQTLLDIENILYGQKNLFLWEAGFAVHPEEYGPGGEIDAAILSPRWAHKLKHKPSKEGVFFSGYFRAIDSSLTLFKTISAAPTQPADNSAIQLTRKL